MCFCATRLFDSPLLAVHDVDCHAAASPRGAEEQAGSHHLVFVRAGVFVKHVGRRQLVADASRVVFFNRGESYQVSHPVDGGDACTMITCAPGTWADLLSRFDASAADRQDAPFGLTHATAPARSMANMQTMRRMLRTGAAEPLAIEALALRIIDDVFADAYVERGRTHSRRRSTRTARRDLAEHTALVLSSRPEARHSLAGLSKTVNASPFHLARVFREETGTSIHQYLLKVRLSLALDRLVDRGESVSTIAHDLGFSSHAHFTTTFQRAFGVAPSVMRRGDRSTN